MIIMCAFSLFDPSSHKHPKKVPKQGTPSPAPKAVKTEIKRAAREKLFKDPELKEWVEKMDKMRKELNEKTNKLLEKGGHTPLSIKRYLDDPKNFSPQDWQLIQKQRDTLEADLGLAIDPAFKKMKKTKETKVLSKERKGKTLGSRKRWLDMH